ncbi:hypothetical protein SKAU_G00380520 [Synaphobranchus kaupii]|uniref:Insulin-like growth factor-binding protein 3 n=1 Tax=Synaphobranchus kaupii TaxID=118154 RepID=A0A9Q1EDJ4_SYNKA|nr:hypothetical protein SKAU_G00380520 [Synaphobranchus kaupii]
MMSSLRFLCLIALLSLTQLGEAVGPVVRCEPCDMASVSQCKPLPTDCAEKVREPGCGCCMTCALSKGQSCGIYTSRCGSGLTCQHRPGETRPLLALLEGRGICSRSTSENRISVPAHGEDNTTDDDGSSKGPGAKDSQHEATAPKATFPHPEAGDVKKDEATSSRRLKDRSLSGGVGMDVQNFSFESKQETEYGPCRREIENILSSFKITDMIYPQGLFIPNCDKKGFYKKKQCRPSKGRQRGFCRCVDKYGHPLPGIDGTERGDAQCYNPDTQARAESCDWLPVEPLPPPLSESRLSPAEVELWRGRIQATRTRLAFTGFRPRLFSGCVAKAHGKGMTDDISAPLNQRFLAGSTDTHTRASADRLRKTSARASCPSRETTPAIDHSQAREQFEKKKNNHGQCICNEAL